MVTSLAFKSLLFKVHVAKFLCISQVGPLILFLSNVHATGRVATCF